MGAFSLARPGVNLHTSSLEKYESQFMVLFGTHNVLLRLNLIQMLKAAKMANVVQDFNSPFSGGILDDVSQLAQFLLQVSCDLDRPGTLDRPGLLGLLS